MNREDVFRWIKSILIALIVFFLFSFYLLERRGYYNLYIVNKVFGSTAVTLAGITLIIRSNIRRYLGLLAFALVLIHVVLSVVFLPNKFPVSWFIKEWLPITFGVLAVLTWAYMTHISRNTKIKQMAEAAFLFIFLHLTVMKYQGWINWWQGKVKQTPELLNPDFPPASLFVFFFMASVILYRIFRKSA